jgi:hypothetical protein
MTRITAGSKNKKNKPEKLIDMKSVFGLSCPSAANETSGAGKAGL